MYEIAHRFALLLGMGTAMAVAVITWIRGVTPFQQSLRAVICGLAVYLLVRLAISVVGEMVLSRLVAEREAEEHRLKADLKAQAKAQAQAQAQNQQGEEETPAA